MTVTKVFSTLFAKLTKAEIVSLCIAALSLLISIATLVYTIKKIEYDIRPVIYVGVGGSQSSTGYYGLLLRNNGMGPAKIEKTMVYFDGRLIDSSERVGDIITKMAYGSQPIDFVISSAIVDRGVVVGAGQEMNICAVLALKEKLDNLSSFDDVLKRISVYIEYSSIGNGVYSAKYPPEQ